MLYSESLRLRWKNKGIVGMFRVHLTSQQSYLLKQFSSLGVKGELLVRLMHLPVHSLTSVLSKEVLKLSIVLQNNIALYKPLN